MTVSDKIIKIGGACGYWGESALATPQLLGAEGLNYIVYDYLAEITMSILARARAGDPTKGYASDFISAALKPNLHDIAKTGVKILSNAGGVNPEACGDAVRALVSDLGLSLRVAVITGDDLMPMIDDIAAGTPREMFKGEVFPARDQIVSMNAYLGAGPIVRALELGADIVITGRCADSALTLAACMHEFNWSPRDHDLLAAGSLAGHLLECGPQATGGNFTDWHVAKDTLSTIGYPIAEIARDGSMVMTKPDETGGVVSVGTVSEQLVYEIEDPQCYLLPDVICDFSEVRVEQIAPDRVAVAGAKGRPPTGDLKVSVTFADGYRAGSLMTFVGFDAGQKARVLADAIIERTREALRRSNLGDFDEVSTEILGADSQFGGDSHPSKEVVLKLAARHSRTEAVGLLLREMAGIGLATPPGLTVFNAGRPKPMPIVRLFSFLVPAGALRIEIGFGADQHTIEITPPEVGGGTVPARHTLPVVVPEDSAKVPLIKLAWARSGDKGDRANIGVIARRPDYIPFIAATLTEEFVAGYFSHFEPSRVERFSLPGLNAINFVLHDSLGGGGVASLRSDPQAKAFAQILLHAEITIPRDLAEAMDQEERRI